MEGQNQMICVVVKYLTYPWPSPLTVCALILLCNWFYSFFREAMSGLM